MVQPMPFWYVVVGLIAIAVAYVGMFRLFRSRKKSKLPYWLSDRTPSGEEDKKHEKP
jgi:uncharacterized membrane protein YwaF